MQPKPTQLPRDIAGAVDLMAQPVAGAVALSALTFGMASHMLGMWMGAIAGAAEASQRLMQSFDKDMVDASEPAKDRAFVPAPAKPATVTVLADARRAMKGSARTRVKRQAAEPVRDDLKLVSGVGPKVEQLLQGMGVSTFKQMAAWTAEDVARIDGAISLGGRIERDGWVKQAKSLASGSKTKQ